MSMSNDAATTAPAAPVGPAATLDKVDGVGIITLNRPYAMNAVNADLSAAVGAALEEIDADPAVQVGIVTGTGRAFCAGADLKALNAGQDVGAPGHPEWGFAGLVEHPVDTPLIAAVNGFALGGGTEIMLSCDLAVLSEPATLGLPEVKRGLFAAAGGLIALPRQFPIKLAMEAALTGEPIPPEIALRWGLVNRVVPAGELMDATLALARAVAANAPLAVRASKRVVRRALGPGAAWDDDVRRLQNAEMAVLLTSEDVAEGTAAFAAKRAPVWRGR
jgi:crotonobetainyl-CoA hydratase